MEFTHFINWDYLGTFTGVVSIVCLIVQFTKQYVDKLPIHIPTQLYSYIVSVGVILLAEVFETGGNGLKLSEAILALLNGFIVSVASNGSYEAITKILKNN